MNATMLVSCVATMILFLDSGCKKNITPEPVTKEEGSRITDVVIDENGNHFRKETFYYNSDSSIRQIVDSTWSNPDPSLKSLLVKVDYQWNNQGNLAAGVYTYGYGVPNATFQFLNLDKHGQVLEIQHHDSANIIQEIWFGTDTQGHITADTIYNENYKEFLGASQFSYDVDENIMKEEIFDPKSVSVLVNTSTRTYTYDQNTNPFYGLGVMGIGFFAAPSYSFYGKNNLLTDTYTNKETGLTHVRSYSYEYNSKKLPVHRRMEDNGLYEDVVFYYK